MKAKTLKLTPDLQTTSHLRGKRLCRAKLAKSMNRGFRRMMTEKMLEGNKRKRRNGNLNFSRRKTSAESRQELPL